MKLIENFKKLDKVNKTFFILIIVILTLLISSILIETNHICLYNKRVEEGNNRWHQVEERIKEYEYKIEVLEELVLNK